MEQQKNMLDHIKRLEIGVPSDRFLSDLSKKIVSENPQRLRSIQAIYWKKIVLIGFSAAAIFILGFLLLNQKGNNELTKNVPSTLAELEQSEIESYIEENSRDFELDSIVEELEIEEQIIKENTETYNQDLEQLFSALTLKEIDQYFKAEGIDPEDPEEDDLLY
jgi:hypothetical protein